MDTTNFASQGLGVSSASEPNHDAIAARAYEIYLEEGQLGGRELDHWLRAEAALRAQLGLGSDQGIPASPLSGTETGSQDLTEGNQPASATPASSSFSDTNEAQQEPKRNRKASRGQVLQKVGV